MSAYQVPDWTINKIVAFLSDKTGHQRIGSKCVDPFLSAAYDLWHGNGHPEDEEYRQAECARLANDLAAMNDRAICARYKEAGESGPWTIYKQEAAPVRLVALKMMHCLRYQCAEGEVPNEPLFASLNETCLLLAQQIVVDSADYDKSAGW